jgi:hypothetical protein
MGKNHPVKQIDSSYPHPNREKTRPVIGVTKWVSMFVLLALFSATAAYGRGMEIKKKLEDYEVIVNLDKHPPVLGDNPLEVEIKEPGGKPVTDAKVLVNYYMPPMPRMAPMNYKSDAPFSKGKYKMTMNIIMSGPWIIRVLITRGGKTSLVKFNVDAQ